MQLAALFMMAGLTGWSVFNLQVVSLVRLFQGAGIEVLPSLMFLQAGLSWMLLRVWTRVAGGSANFFFASALSAGAIIAFTAHSSWIEDISHAEGGWWAFGALFIFSQLLINALRMGIHVLFSRRISVLSNPQISTQLAIAEEFGLLTGVICVQTSSSFTGAGSFLVALTPFGLGLFIHLLVMQGGPADRRPEAKPAAVESARAALSRRSSPFLSWLVMLFSMVASLKSLQWFGMAFGLSEANRQGLPILGLFSKLALIQSTLTLGILVASLSFSRRIPTWGLGFRILLITQAVGGALLSLTTTPYLLMGCEVVRKVLEHGFLGRSLQLLTSTFPEESRLESRQAMERWSTTSGTAFAGVLAYWAVKGYLPFGVLWASMMGLALLGLYFRRRLFEMLSDFHVARLRQSRLDGVLLACHALANPDCREHHAALSSLLERGPRPAVRKAILRALGRLRHPAVVPSLLANTSSDREDVQLAAVRALEWYRGHEINFALLESLRTMVRSETTLRISVVRSITQRLGVMVVPYLVEVLEGRPDERVAANAVEILGEIAVAEKDDDLRDYLAKFLSTDRPRRVRANAIVALYRHPVHGAKAREAFDRLLTSDQPKELDASAYVAGVLELRGHESFIWERSEQEQHRNSTLLVSLLRLGNPRAPAFLATWVTGSEEPRAKEALVRLSALESGVRAKVFAQVVADRADMLSLLIARMRASQRDFEIDRELIREEVRRLGLPPVDEESSVETLVAARTERKAA